MEGESITVEMTRLEISDAIKQSVMDTVSKSMRPHMEKIEAGLKEYFQGNNPWTMTDSKFQKSLTWAMDHVADRVMLEIIEESGFVEAFKEEVKAKLSDKDFIAELAKNKVTKMVDDLK